MRDKEKCTGCRKCDKVCPMSIQISTKNSINGFTDCISCYNCINHNEGCSKNVGALSLEFFGKKISTLKFATISLLVYIVATAITIYLYPEFLDL